MAYISHFYFKIIATPLTINRYLDIIDKCEKTLK